MINQSIDHIGLFGDCFVVVMEQAGVPKFLFEGKTIQRMEILVLNSLNWRIKAYTPCNFIDYYLRKMNEGGFPLGPVIGRSLRIILTTIEGFLLV